jgi:hypothetical protein
VKEKEMREIRWEKEKKREEGREGGRGAEEARR